jgi:hypothetical protein
MQCTSLLLQQSACSGVGGPWAGNFVEANRRGYVYGRLEVTENVSPQTGDFKMDDRPQNTDVAGTMRNCTIHAGCDGRSNVCLCIAQHRDVWFFVVRCHCCLSRACLSAGATPASTSEVESVPKPRKKCSHNRQPRKECKGSGFRVCIHGRDKPQCKECKGSGICTHGRNKSQFKECGGSSICPHGRKRSSCKDCGGSSICPHGRRKPECKECGGSAICPHGRPKSRCKECPAQPRSSRKPVKD